MEETEGGYITVNLEDTRVEVEELQQFQNDVPELILEETKGGDIIVNWEETRVEDEESSGSNSTTAGSSHQQRKVERQ